VRDFGCLDPREIGTDISSGVGLDIDGLGGRDENSLRPQLSSIAVDCILYYQFTFVLDAKPPDTNSQYGSPLPNDSTEGLEDAHQADVENVNGRECGTEEATESMNPVGVDEGIVGYSESQVFEVEV
jgi:hypothetical protein